MSANFDIPKTTGDRIRALARQHGAAFAAERACAEHLSLDYALYIIAGRDPQPKVDPYSQSFSLQQLYANQRNPYNSLGQQSGNAFSGLLGGTQIVGNRIFP